MKEIQTGLFNPEIEGATVDELGLLLPVDADVDEGRIIFILERAATLAKCAHFIMGDAINYALAHYEGDVYGRYSELTGLETGTLKNAANVAKKIPRESRRLSLTFEHHKICAPLEDAPRDHWLEVAEEHKLNRARLRKSILLGRLATDEDMQEEPGGGDDNLAPHVNRIVTFGRRLEESGYIESAAPESLFALHRDLLPAIQLHVKIMRALRATGDLTIEQELADDLRSLQS